MNSLFGDATTAAPTPATIAEAESFFSGNRSPVPSFRLGAEDDNVPDIDDLAPPDLDGNGANGKGELSDGRKAEGEGGWISNLVKRGKEGDANGSGKYQKVGQDDD